MLDRSCFSDAELGGVQHVCVVLALQWLQERVASYNHRGHSGYLRRSER